MRKEVFLKKHHNVRLMAHFKMHKPYGSSFKLKIQKLTLFTKLATNNCHPWYR